MVDFKKRLQPKPPTRDNNEATIQELRRLLDSTNTAIAICSNDMKRAMDTMEEKYGVKSIEEALKLAEDLNEELAAWELEKAKLIEEIKTTMVRYSNERLQR